jgi:hypothetical protein
VLVLVEWKGVPVHVLGGPVRKPARVKVKLVRVPDPEPEPLRRGLPD